MQRPLGEAAGEGKDRRCPQFCRPVFASLAADKVGSPTARFAARKSASLPPPAAPPRKRAHADGQAARRRTGKPLMQTNTLSIAPAITDTAAYPATYDMAQQRAAVSDFDVHVVMNADGSYWYVDEGDYACELTEIEDRIVHTLAGRMSGLY